MLRVDDIKDEFLVCSVCHNEFNEDNNLPRVMPCLHACCEDCLRKIMSKHTVKCPTCNTKCSVTCGGIQGFPIDVTRRNLLEFVKVKKRSSEIKCRDCPDDSTASDFCRDCYIFMCIECTNAHRRSLASRSHVVLSIDELQRSGPDVFKRKMKCSKVGHEGQPLEFYCSNTKCKLLVCATCTICDHDESKGHVIQKLADYYSRKTTKLRESLEVMDENIKVSKSTVQDYKQHLVDMDIKEYEAEKDIDTHFSTCMKILENRKKEMKDELSTIYKSKKSDLQTQIVILERFVEDMSNARDFLQCIIQHTDPSEFVTLYATFCKRLQTLAKQNIDTNLDFNMASFEPIDMGVELCTFVQHMGRISSVNNKLVALDNVPLERSLTDTCSSSLKPLQKSNILKPSDKEMDKTDLRQSDDLTRPNVTRKMNTNKDTQRGDLNLSLMSTSPVLDDKTDQYTVQTKGETDGSNRLAHKMRVFRPTNRTLWSKSLELSNPVLLRGKTDAGGLLPSLPKTSEKKKPYLSKSQTELGATLYPTSKVAELSDRKPQNIVCPAFTFDEKTVHKYRQIVNGSVLKNEVDEKTCQMNEYNLRNFRGVIASRSFKHQGKFYFEVIVNYVIKKSLDNSNMVFEAGLCRQNEIDCGYCVFNQEHGWSYSVQYCQEHQSLCHLFRHAGKCFAHMKLSSSAKTGSKVMLHCGFLLDTDHKKWTIVDCESQKCLYKFQGVDFTHPMWPVFGCHWPSKVKVEITLVTGRNISIIPNSIHI